MIVYNIPTNNTFYQSVYKFEYMQGPMTLGMKKGDAWPAACYIHDIFQVPILYNIQEQIDYIRNNRCRAPSSVVEIGSGIGEFSCSLSFLEYQVDSVECNPSAIHFHRATSRRFFDQYPKDNHRLFNADLTGYLPYLPENISDLVLIESIEHIVPSEWDRFYQSVLPVLKSNHSRLTITNQKNYWPLGFKGDVSEHIALIDDTFYDKLSQDARLVVYRDKSHICLEF